MWLTQQLEAFKSLTGVPAPPYFGLVSSTSQRIGVLSPWRTWWSEIGDPRKGLLLIWGAGEGISRVEKTCGARRSLEEGN